MEYLLQGLYGVDDPGINVFIQPTMF